MPYVYFPATIHGSPLANRIKVLESKPNLVHRLVAGCTDRRRSVCSKRLQASVGIHLFDALDAWEEAEEAHHELV